MSDSHQQPDPDKVPVDGESPTIPVPTDALAGPTPCDGGESTREVAPPGAEVPGKVGRGERSATKPLPQIDGYEILEKIAQGGMGIVYRARQIRMNRTVALKVIRSGSLADDEQVARFYTEAEAAGSLDHPAIVPIYEVGESNGQHFYSMAFVDGHSLADVLQQRVFNGHEAARILLTLAEAMQHAHDHQVIHRDLKPANVLLAHAAASGGGTSSHSRGKSAATSKWPGISGSGESAAEPEWIPKITDFGLAKQIEAESDLTSTGQVLGTPSFMPPEQVKATGEVGPAADIYALGAVLYAMLTSRPPFQAASAIETLRQVMDRDPVPPTRLNPSVDRDLETICLKCLEKNPTSRYASAAELAGDVRAYLNGEPISARPISLVERAWRWCRRKPAAALALATLAGLVVSLVVVALVMAQLRYSQQYAATQAAKLEAAEKERKLREAELASARQLAQQRAKLAQTQRYFGLVGDARALMAERRMGWSFTGLEKIHQAAEIDVPEVVDRSALRDLTVRLLKGPDARLIREIKMPAGYRSYLIDFAPDGKQLAIATMKNRLWLRVLLCDAATGEVQKILGVKASLAWQFKTTNMDGIRAMSYVRDGTALAILTRSGWLYVWDLTDDAFKRTGFKFPKDGLDDVCFHPSRPELYYAEGKGLMRWKWESGEDPLPFGQSIFPERIGSLSIDRAGRRLAASGGGTIAVFDLDSFHTVNEPYSEHGAGRVALSPDGRLLAFADGQSPGRILDLEMGQPATNIKSPNSGSLHTEPCTSLCFSGDGLWLVSTSRDRRLYLWDVTSGTIALEVAMPGQDHPRAVTDDHARFLAATGESSVWLFELLPHPMRSLVGPFSGRVISFDTGDAERLTVVATMSDNEQARVMAVDPASGRVDATYMLRALPEDVAVAEQAPTVAWLDVWHGLHTLKLPDDFSQLSPDERERLFSDASSWHDRELEDPRLVELEDDGRAALICWRGNLLLKWSLEKREVLSEWDNRLRASLAGTASFTDIDWRGSLGLAAATNTTLWMFERDHLRSQHPTGRVANAVVIRPDGAQVLYGLNQGEVIACTPQGAEQFRWQAHDEPIRSLAFSADGRLLAVGSADRTVSLWERRNGRYRRLATLPQEAVLVHRVRFVGDRLLVLPKNDRFITVWNWKRLLAYYREHALLEEITAIPSSRHGRRPAAEDSPANSQATPRPQ